MSTLVIRADTQVCPYTLQLAEPINLFADDGEAILPEFFAGDVNAESFGEFRRRGFARGGKQVHVIGHKVLAAFLIDSIQARRKKQAERIGEIVE